MVKELRFLKFIASLIDGYENSYLNFEDNTKNAELIRRLSEISRKLTLRDANDLDFTDKENQNIEEFF